MAKPSKGMQELLAASGYQQLRLLGGLVCGLKQFPFTTALVVGLDGVGYQYRYCYEHGADAQAALRAWDG